MPILSEGATAPNFTLQTDHGAMTRLRTAGVLPGEKVELERSELGYRVGGVDVPRSVASHLFVTVL